MNDSPFTHLDAAGQPRMVDVSGKTATRRVAVAGATVRLGRAVVARIREGELPSSKGPVFHTAILAGIQAAKRTSETIPLCHPVPLAKCDVAIEPLDDERVAIRTEAATDARTGVEMEALAAASGAALTLYDMCKAVSRDIVIENVRLLEKTGGKSDYRAGDPEPPQSSARP